MKLTRILLVLFLILISVSLCLFGCLYFTKTSTVNIENQFGKFSITCPGYELASGKSIAGFGICSCSENISNMEGNLNTVLLNKYKSYLEKRQQSKLVENILTIEKSLQLNDLELYRKTLNEYSSNFNQLKESERLEINSFLKNLE